MSKPKRDEVHDCFHIGSPIEYIVEIAITGTLCKDSMDAIKGETLRQLTEDHDFFILGSTGKWLLRPNGRKLLGKSLKLLAEATTKAMK